LIEHVLIGMLYLTGAMVTFLAIYGMNDGYGIRHGRAVISILFWPVVMVVLTVLAIVEVTRRVKW
jgi:hypothetical protein